MNKLKYPLPFHIRKALGLLPWDEFKEKAIKRNREIQFGQLSYGISEPDRLIRGSGRTTKMLVQAVYFAQNRKVYIAGYSAEYTNRLVNDAKLMCFKLGIPVVNIKGLPKNTRGLGDIWSFVDHHYPFYLTGNSKPSKEYF